MMAPQLTSIILVVKKIASLFVLKPKLYLLLKINQFSLR